MKRVLSIGPGPAQRNYRATLMLADHPIEVERIGTSGDSTQVAALLRAYDGQVDAIALEGLPLSYRIAGAQYIAHRSARIAAQARMTPVVDGSMVQATLERWAITRANDSAPDLLRQRRVLVLGGCERYALAEVLAEQTARLRFADAILQTGLAFAPKLRTLRQLGRYAAIALPLLLAADALPPAAAPGRRVRARLQALWRSSEVIVGSFATLQQLAPHDLHNQTLITDDPSAAEIEQMRQRGLAALVTLTPPLHPAQPFVSCALLEALLLALQPGRRSLSPSSVLQFIAAAGWEPTIHHLNPPRRRPVFAFVVHPMVAQHIARKPPLGFTRYLPAPLVEHLAAYAPPLQLSRIRGLQSQATGQPIEGVLITLGATPREMLRRPPGFTYKRLVRAAHMAEQMGVRIMGLGAFTSVVGDAGLSVARQTSIGITTGNTLTVAATLETARLALQAMGGQMEHACIVIMGATGSIGAACARLLAAEGHRLVLIAPRPERLLALQQQIARENPAAQVTIALPPDAALGEADLIITATTALTGDVLNLQMLKPGAVVCDVARPANVRPADAAQRPDILVVESGEIELPGTPAFGFEIDLPPGSAYACLAETALLAMEGIFEDYTIGRTIDIERVAHILHVMHKHGGKLAQVRSFGHVLTPEELAEKRRLAARAAASLPSALPLVSS